ncbi:Gfo/Idh/MocA family oxidoreductase [Microbacterium sp. CFH 90308]|uniref:Gfo/Idh/MocA family oxidoreductase n=1 Tax=Microbacterium salsuginis TaxID=2722803 RepID=A0ABX1KFX1_9MICO|nr:Gfo/Idh/MocA family oxidoreductase [Microbacterium sp. CFH 90308]NLP85270.1 Gfo/Idh/MocA family oxidoreductase [Microbacterium sp. CFH 90308]
MSPTREPDPVRVGLVGLGNSGRHYHLPLLTRDPRFRLVGVATESGAADPHPVDVRVHRGWRDLLDREPVDLLVVATPHHLHHEIAAAALDRGVNVLVEKPMTVTVREADDLMRRADRAGAVLAVHHQRRWEEDFQALLGIVRSGEIGAPWRVVATRGHQGDYVNATASRPHAGPRPLRWARERSAGGGVLRVIGPHPVDHVLRLADRSPLSVAGRVSVAAGEQVERWAGLELDFGDGLTGRVEVFRRQGVPGARFAVWGEDGMAVASDGAGVVVRRHDGVERVVSGLAKPGILGGEIYDDVYAAIRTGAGLRATAAEAREVVHVIELCERSAAEGGRPLPA